MVATYTTLTAFVGSCFCEVLRSIMVRQLLCFIAAWQRLLYTCVYVNDLFVLLVPALGVDMHRDAAWPYRPGWAYNKLVWGGVGMSFILLLVRLCHSYVTLTELAGRRFGGAYCFLSRCTRSRFLFGRFCLVCLCQRFIRSCSSLRRCVFCAAVPWMSLGTVVNSRLCLAPRLLWILIRNVHFCDCLPD